MAGADRGVRRGWLFFAVVLVLAPRGAFAEPAPARTTAPGTYAYRYEAQERVNGAPQTGYRTDFDLRVAKDGGVEAVIRAAEHTSDGKSWSDAVVDPACRAAMRGSHEALAVVRLWPVERAADPLGSGFLDLCAPDAVFFPLTDILNVAVIRLSSRFKADRLKRVGDKVRYDGFEVAFERGPMAFHEVSRGGEIALSRGAGRGVLLEWSPDIADLTIRRGQPGAAVSLVGTEHFGFRLELDRRTGALGGEDHLRRSGSAPDRRRHPC